MGTMLYSRGVFINRCYDELNLREAETVRAVHHEYLQAGAEVIETNTFGGNSFRLERFGLGDKVHAINLAGAQIARQSVDAIREKQGTEAFVAGAIGPLGVRIEPLGKTSLDEARAAFAEQIEALAEGGVDLLMIETMMSIDEAEQAVLAAREVAPHLPVVVMVTVDEEGNALDGSSPEVAAGRLVAAGVDALGCNCSSGPATVLSVIECMRKVTKLPLIAMPNAGMPRNVEGRNIYLTSPEYMASFARKFVKAGANWVGGCCGTTPLHIKAMRGALRAMGAQDSGEHTGAKPNLEVLLAEHPVQPQPLAERSLVGAKIASGEFLTLVEIVSPKGIDCTKELEGAAYLHDLGVHAINVPDSPRASARMSAQSLCVQIQQKVGIETVLHYTCRDRNVLSIQSDLLGASSIGLKNILCLTGDPPKLGNYPDATAVFDVDAIGLVNIVRNLNYGLDIGKNSIGESTGFTIAVAANPGVPDIEQELRRFAYKVEAGAEYAITQPVFDLRLLEEFLKRVEQYKIPVIAGIWPLTIARMAAQTTKEGAFAEGIAIAREMVAAVRGSVQGVQVSAPFGKYHAAAQVLGLV